MHVNIVFIDTRIQWFVCSMHKLLELFDKRCRRSNCDSLYQVNVTTNGCCILLRGNCSAGHTFHWECSDTLMNQNNARLFLDNLQLSCLGTIIRT